MSHYATLSKCCSAPCLVRGDETKYYACGECKEPTDRKRIVLDTKEKLKEFLDSRPAWSYTASTTLTRPKPRRTPSMIALVVGCAIGIILFWALV